MAVVVVVVAMVVVVVVAMVVVVVIAMVVVEDDFDITPGGWSEKMKEKSSVWFEL